MQPLFCLPKHIFLYIMRQKLLYLISYYLISFFVMLNAEVKAPDFAFPKKVATDSEKNLKTAIKNGDEQGIVRSIIDLTLAKSAVSENNIPEMLKQIKTIIDEPSSSSQLKAMLNLVSADIYKSIYDNNKWTYNRRNLPLEPLPADYTEWSGEQFRQVIKDYAVKAVADKEELNKTPITDFRSVITIEKNTEYLFPSLLDFVAYNAIELVDEIEDKDAMLPLRWLCGADFFISSDFSNKTENADIIADIFKSLIELKTPGSSSYILADIKRIKWMEGHIKYDERGGKVRELLLDIYNKYKDNEDCALAILAIDVNVNDIDANQVIYDALQQYSKKFPNSIYRQKIAEFRNCLTRKSANVSFPSVVVPGVDFTVDVSYENVGKVYVRLYSLRKKTAKYNTSYIEDKLIKEIELNDTSNLLFRAKKQLTFSVPDYGLYTVKVYYRGVENSNYVDSYNIIRATRLFPIVLRAADMKHTRVYVADVITGKPVEGVTVKSDTYIGITDRNGMALINVLNDSSDNIFVSKGDDKYADRVYSSELSYDTDLCYASVTTDLPIYHQGDNVQWSVVVYQKVDDNNSVMKNQKVRVIIRDANYQEIDNNEYVTDNFGRVRGSLKLPETGLLGYFSVGVEIENEELGNVGSFMVSDYKLPTFEVKVNDVQRDVPEKGAVTVKGVATDYSGFSIADAKVAVTAKSSDSYWWFITDEEDFFTSEVATDENGVFTVVLDKEDIENADYPKGLISVYCNVTSQAGETRSTSTSFTLGKPYAIRVQGDENVNVESPVNLGISVSDALGNEKVIPLTVTIFDGDKIVFNKTVKTPSELLDMKDVATGQYKVEIAPVDSASAEKYIGENKIFYNPSKKEFPVKQILWTPNSSLNFTSRKGDLILATDRDSLTINLIALSGGTIVDQKWVTIEKGINHLPVMLPDSINSAMIRAIGINDIEDFNIYIAVSTPPAREKFKLGIETFRDRVLPGDLETITFKTTYPAGVGVESAVVLNMFSQSIDDILAHSPLKPYIRGAYEKNSIDFRGISILSDSHNEYIRFYNYSISDPKLNLWNRDWIQARYIRGYGLHYSRMCMSSANDAGDVQYDMAMPMVKEESAAVEGAVEGCKLEECVVVNGGDDKVASKPAESEQYRPSEEPLAFFEPMLTTDKDGNLEFSFTYPQSSTTWILNATAFTEDMKVDTQTRKVVASRPLMVKCALPRFLRQGDKAVLAATIMNNTDSACDNVSVKAELFDTATGESITAVVDTVSLGAMESRVVYLPVQVEKAGTPMLFRIKASDGINSDGEQNLILTLEAAQPVIETRPFYMGIDQTSVQVPVPRGENANVTLEFYENPTWSVVTALPGLRNETPCTSTDAAGSIFSAAVAEGVIKQNPEIASALRYWLESDKSDSTLTSMLSKNQDLKVALLECTPWMLDAMNDTQRMTRLALLLDNKEIKHTYDVAIDVLAKLQRNGGGWAWCSYGEKSSEWATQNVLAAFAMLKQIGFYPSSKKLDNMVKNAVLYLDAQIAKHNKDANKTLTDMLYTYTRLYYPEIKQSTASNKTSDKTVQEIVADWKSYSLHEKALSVIILNRSNYPSMAKVILSSINEYSSETEEKGMWWDNLDSRCWWSSSVVSTTSLILNAYNEVEPSSKDIDKIRQWLLLEKCRNDWGDAVATSHAVAAIIGSGSKWLIPASTRCAVKVNQELVTPSKIEKITGHFRTDISDLVTGPSVLTIDKVEKIPAYGALYSITTQKMADVKSHSCDELSVEKRFLVKRLTPDGEKWEETNEFHVGDIVKISLTLKAKETMSYVAIVDNRPACLEPVNQLPTPVYSEGLYFYRETRNDCSSLFIDFLRKGTFILEQEFTVTHAGEFASGLATAQSQYAPQFSAHSAGAMVTVK